MMEEYQYFGPGAPFGPYGGGGGSMVCGGGCSGDGRGAVSDENEKEEKRIMNTLKVEYNGFTGELVKLERLKNVFNMSPDGITAYLYNLSIYDGEKEATCSFEKVKLEDIKLLGGAVSFG